jgi:hypothetical protein
MRIVIDSNQLSLFLSKINPPGVVHGEGITIAPYVFAEMLLHPDAQQLVRQLRSFDILVGLEPSDVMAELSALDEKAIVSFMPYNPTFTLPTRLEGQDISLARSIKASNRAFANTMFGCAKLFRKRLRDEGLKHKFSGMSEVLELSFLQSLVFDSVSHKQARTLAVPDEKYLYVAVMHNRYLSRYFKMILCYVISYSRAWADQTWNFDPSGNIDDWTDITLPLYAADGDIILTADKKLRTAISIIERPDAVHVKTVQEL